MKSRPWTAAAALLLASVAGVAAIERLPIENFAKTPEASQALLSPDGGRVAFLADHIGVGSAHRV